MVKSGCVLPPAAEILRRHDAAVGEGLALDEQRHQGRCTTSAGRRRRLGEHGIGAKGGDGKQRKRCGKLRSHDVPREMNPSTDYRRMPVSASRHDCPQSAGEVLRAAVSSARTRRSSRSRGGLPSTRSTCGGVWPSASRRSPQPVSSTTGRVGRSPLHGGGDTAAIDMRHAEIGDDNRNGSAVRAAAKRGRRRCPLARHWRRRWVTVQFQRLAQRIEQDRIVIHQQDRKACG